MMLLNRIFIIALVSSLGFGINGCKSRKKGAADQPSVVSSSAPLELQGTSDQESAGGLTTVRFAFNSFTLGDEARELLEANAEFLKEHSSVRVLIEGHCDDRGGREYNLALGQKRATATRDYLVSLGVLSSQLTTTSYGKERPVAFADMIKMRGSTKSEE